MRFSEWVNGKRRQRTLTFDGAKYPKEADVRKAIELTVPQINSGAAGEKADAKFRSSRSLRGFYSARALRSCESWLQPLRTF